MPSILNPFTWFGVASSAEIAGLRALIINQGNTIMATQAEHAQALRDAKAQNDKARAEQVAALAKLQAALDAAGGTTAEVDEAFAELKASIQTDDDQNADATTEG